MKKLIPLFALLLASGFCRSQVIIRPGTSITFNQTPDIVIQTSSAITTNNATNFSGANLHLDLGGTLTISGDVAATMLRLTSEGNKTINNTLTVSGGMEFTNGILVLSPTGKILFTGEGTSVTGGNDLSFVDGLFHQSGGGFRFYPVGTGSSYAPVTFENIAVTSEVGIRAVDQDPALTFDPLRIIAVDPTRYWEVAAPDLSSINSRVTLGISDIFAPSTGSLSVLQATAINSEAVNLGYSSIDASQVTSRSVVSNNILAIGTVPEIIVKVHDLITPFILGDANDKLYIEQIEAFDFNTVTLLDRWGVVIKRWENFTNDVDYDFSKLSPGNYIVVAEFGNVGEESTTEKISQMVTVLKTN